MKKIAPSGDPAFGKMDQRLLVFLLVLATRGLLADDFKTNDGKEYKNVTVRRVEPDGIVLTTNFGISKVYFTELPKEVQERFHYDPQKATDYSVQQNAALEQAQKQQAAAMQEMQQKADARQKTLQNVGKQQALQILQQQYTDLQSMENDLEARLQQANQPGRIHRERTRKGMRTVQDLNPLVNEIAPLQNKLKAVRKEKSEVERQFNEVKKK
jgi:hypothetical protein